MHQLRQLPPRPRSDREHRFSGRPRGGGAGAGAGAGPGDARPVRHRLLPDHGGVAQPRRPDHGSGPVTPEQAEP